MKCKQLHYRIEESMQRSLYKFNEFGFKFCIIIIMDLSMHADPDTCTLYVVCLYTCAVALAARICSVYTLHHHELIALIYSDIIH